MPFPGKPTGEYRKEMREVVIMEGIKPRPLPINRAALYDPNYDPPTAYQVFANGLDIPSVCKALQITRQTYYRWIEDHPAFADACHMGKEASESYWDERADKHVVIVTEKDGPKVSFNTDLHKFVKKTVYKAKEDAGITINNFGADLQKEEEIKKLIADMQAQELK